MNDMLEVAAEQMVIQRDFQAAFDTCNRSLDNLRSSTESDDDRCAEFKAGFCILGIQALAELNQWQSALSWVLQQYEQVETVPAKIMQMCILLYSKVGHPVGIQEAARVWLHRPCNSRVSGFGTVAELYLLHVLVPQGQTEEAREMIVGTVGNSAFTEDQRQMALDVVEEKAQQTREPPPDVNPNSEMTSHSVSPKGAVVRKLEAALRCLYRKLFVTSFSSFSLRRIFLAVVFLYLIFVRMDPALPSTFMWISKLLQLIKQMWRSTFKLYYSTPSDSMGL
ncbi:peroxisome assembly protein 26 [Cynoglossus semilaevis]|uniref:Peroxisomal biogenesis factor 26 n=1 Tax=Cynoglossus semilaevis TaxID=244447 RepID=A0A3P8V9V9_CYNSE|nr:peroxisome assembly protein 26 [Cynoglossus semilaevis]XP_024913663.1 peroxisome assembly protein 26 [Cynoglossus semilaevis]